RGPPRRPAAHRRRSRRPRGSVGGAVAVRPPRIRGQHGVRRRVGLRDGLERALRADRAHPARRRARRRRRRTLPFRAPSRVRLLALRPSRDAVPAPLVVCVRGGAAARLVVRRPRGARRRDAPPRARGVRRLRAPRSLSTRAARVVTRRQRRWAYDLARPLRPLRPRRRLSARPARTTAAAQPGRPGLDEPGLSTPRATLHPPRTLAEYSALQTSTAIGTVFASTMGAPSKVAPIVRRLPPSPAGSRAVAPQTPAARRAVCTAPSNGSPSTSA